jgi:hypothetical protein
MRQGVAGVDNPFLTHLAVQGVRLPDANNSLSKAIVYR